MHKVIIITQNQERIEAIKATKEQFRYIHEKKNNIILSCDIIIILISNPLLYTKEI